MNIAYSSSDSFSWLASISLVSLLENNKNEEEINVFILENKISDLNKNKLKNISLKYKRSIKFIPFSEIVKITSNLEIENRWNPSTFGGLFLAKLLPANIEKVLCIDCDTIIKDSILPLWNTNIDNKAVFGVKECLSAKYSKRIGNSSKDTMLNAGLLLFNLKYIRDNDIVTKFTNKIINSNSLLYLDQDVLNSVLSNSEKGILDLKYNVYSLIYYCNYRQIKLTRHPANFYSKQEVENAVKNPVIIHFTTCFLDSGRAWNVSCSHPLRDEFLIYKELSPFKNEELINNDKNKIKRNKIFKLFTKSFLCWMTGIIHAYIRPTFKK